MIFSTKVSCKPQLPKALFMLNRDLFIENISVSLYQYQQYSMPLTYVHNIDMTALLIKTTVKLLCSNFCVLSPTSPQNLFPFHCFLKFFFCVFLTFFTYFSALESGFAVVHNDTYGYMLPNSKNNVKNDNSKKNPGNTLSSNLGFCPDRERI